MKTTKQITLNSYTVGIDETKANIANKLSRGTFSFIFALQIFEAIGIKTLRLKDQYDSTNKKQNKNFKSRNIQ